MTVAQFRAFIDSKQTLYKTDLSPTSPLWSSQESEGLRGVVGDGFQSVLELGRRVVEGLERGVDEIRRGDGMDDACGSWEEVRFL